MASRTRYALWLSPLAALAALAACQGDPRPEDAVDTQAATASFELPRQGADDSFDVGNWNVEWFLTPNIGPADDEQQLANVREVIRQADLDLWGLNELVARDDLDRLVEGLPGYEALMVTDAAVEGGGDYNAGQKLGILYKRDVVSLVKARVLFAAQDDLFGQRPPLEATLRVTVGGDALDLVFIVVHLKANTGPAAQMWDQRRQSAELLKGYLEAEHPNEAVLVVGDFNDDTDVSISKPKPTPFATFVDDAARYRFLTKPLSDARQRSTVNFAEFIDHQLASNEAAALAIFGSERVLGLESIVPDYEDTTSDHFPVLSRFALGGAPPPPPPPPPPEGARVLLNEALANEPGSSAAGEFVELVNAGTAAADLGGFTLSDGAALRHAFAPGTALAAGERIAVFGGAAGVPAGAGRTVVASTGGLSLNNTGDTLTLRDAGGAAVDAFAYPGSLASQDGVSMNRSPDADPAGTFVLHTQIAGEPASPGR